MYVNLDNILSRLIDSLQEAKCETFIDVMY